MLRLTLFWLSCNQIPTESYLSLCVDTTNYVEGGKSLIAGGAEYEHAFFSFGPVYPLFVAGMFLLFGLSALPIILVQILLSAVSCGLIYSLARHLTGSRAISIVAGGLAALSITSIELSCFVLSDTLYLFTVLVGLNLLMRGLDRCHLLLSAASGLVFGVAVLMRSIGQFWPLVIVAIAATVYFKGKTSRSDCRIYRTQIVQCAAACLAILLIFELGWIARNQAVHGLPTLAFTSASGPATVAALSLNDETDRYYRDTMGVWLTDYYAQTNTTSISAEDYFRLLQRKAREIFAANPVRMIKAYLRLCRTNVNDVTYLHRDLVPAFNPKTIPIEHYLKEHYLNYASFVLSILGLIILTLTRRWHIAVVLGTIYFYYALMVGAFPWQGSRLFYPGLIADSILIAVVIVGVGSLLKVIKRH